MLNILETFNLTAMGHNTADYLHVHIEAKKLAFADRAKFYGDPDFGEPTAELIEWLVSKEYGRERAKLINMGRYAARSTQLIGTLASRQRRSILSARFLFDACVLSL